MIKKIILSLAFISSYFYAVEHSYPNIQTPDVAHEIDLFEDILNDWNPSTPAQLNPRVDQRTLQSRMRASKFVPKPLESAKAAVVRLSKGDPLKIIVLEGFEFNTSLSHNENKKILADLIKKRRTSTIYRCCLAHSQLAMDWKEFTSHVRRNHAEGKKVQCPHCSVQCANHQLGYEHIAAHEHKDLFKCPNNCAKNIDARDSQRALEIHFEKCLHKDPVLTWAQNDTNLNNPGNSTQPSLATITNQRPDQAVSELDRGEPVSANNRQLLFLKFCREGVENIKVPNRYHVTDSVSQITNVVKSLHQKRSENFVQCFTTWFGIINYIIATKEGTKSVCPMCTKTQAVPNRAASCYLKHWDNKAFECPKCNSVPKDFDEYKKHTERCNLLTSIPIGCQTMSQDTPMAHVESEKKRIDDALQKITCCGLVLSNWSVAQNHIASHKKAMREYLCPHCKVSYTNNTKSLECLIKSIDETIFNCTLCNAHCKTREELLRHVELDCTQLNEVKSPDSNSAHDSVARESNSALTNVSGTQNIVDSHPYASSEYQQTFGLHEQSTAIFNEDNHHPDNIEQTTYNLADETFACDYRYDYNPLLPQITGDMNDYDQYMPSQLSNEIVDNSLNEYHNYFKNHSTQ